MKLRSLHNIINFLKYILHIKVISTIYVFFNNLKNNFKLACHRNWWTFLSVVDHGFNFWSEQTKSYKKSLEIPKRQSKSVNRRGTDNVMATRTS